MIETLGRECQTATDQTSASRIDRLNHSQSTCSGGSAAWQRSVQTRGTWRNLSCVFVCLASPSARSVFEFYWITLTLLHTHTQTPALLRKKLRDREAKPSFNLHQLKRICLPRVHREKESEAGRQRERGGNGGGGYHKSLNRYVDLHERRRAVLTCWVTLRLGSVFLIYRWLSEHKWAAEMLKNANGTPPSLTP